MSYRSSWVLLTLVLAAAVSTARAHHAQAPFFDQERTVEVRGTVVRWIFRNPHPVLEVELREHRLVERLHCPLLDLGPVPRPRAPERALHLSRPGHRILLSVSPG